MELDWQEPNRQAGFALGLPAYLVPSCPDAQVSPRLTGRQALASSSFTVSSSCVYCPIAVLKC